MFVMISEILTAGSDRFFLKMLTFVQFLDLVVRINHYHYQILPLPLASWQILTTKLRICTKVHIFKKNRSDPAVKISENINNIIYDDFKPFGVTF